MRSEDVYRAIGAVFVGLVFLFGVFALIKFISVSPLWSAEGAAWIQAIGSIAAIWVAVLISSRDNRLRQNETLAIGLIAAVEISATAVQQANEIGDLISTFNAAEELAFPDSTLKYAIASLEGMRSWNVSEISQLSGFKSDVALALARSQHMRSVVLRSLKRIRNEYADTDLARFTQLCGVAGVLSIVKWNLDESCAQMVVASAPAARAGIDI